jgi:hypothetical protein
MFCNNAIRLCEAKNLNPVVSIPVSIESETQRTDFFASMTTVLDNLKYKWKTIKKWEESSSS